MDAIVEAGQSELQAQAEAMAAWALEQWQAGDREAILAPPIVGLDEVQERLRVAIEAIVADGEASAEDEAQSQLDDVPQETLEGLTAAELAGYVRARSIVMALPPLDPTDAESIAGDFIQPRAEAMTAIVSQAVLSAYLAALTPMLEAGAIDTAALMSAIAGLALRDLRTKAQETAPKAIQVGRQAVEQRLTDADLVAYHVYSTQRDSNVCPKCAVMEAEIIEPGSPEAIRWHPPLMAGLAGPCDGRQRCRCDYLTVLKGSGDIVRDSTGEVIGDPIDG